MTDCIERGLADVAGGGHGEGHEGMTTEALS